MPYSLDLQRLSDAYSAGALTPTLLVENVLAQIESSRKANPAWIHVMPREALLARAAELEQKRARGERLPLYGVPFAVKDNIDVAAHPTTAGCPAFSYVASKTAHAVQRLEDAGALCIGKTNLDQFATGLVGTRSPYGACVNPFDARYISGGSSSGSALAVALGHVSFALGTDTAGSGRVPAGFCNVVGLKPTRGLIGMSGVVPACRSLDCISIFALTAEDALAVLDVARGPDPHDPYSRGDTASLTPRALSHPRCGVPRASQLQFFGDELARQAFDHALETLQALGAEIVEIDYEPFAEVAQLLYEGPWVAERLAAIKPFFEASPEALLPVTREIIDSGKRYSALDAFEAQYRLQALKSRCARQWERMDMLVVPTAGTIYTVEGVTADPVKLNSNLGYYTNFVNLLDLSAIAVPGGFRRDGLPFGMTLIAPALEDATLSQWGSRFHRAAQVKLGATSFDLPNVAQSSRSDAASASAPNLPSSPTLLPRGEGCNSSLPAGEGSGEGNRSGRDAVPLAVVGAHLSGLPLNRELTSRGARLLESCATSAQYRLYALPDTAPRKPGLARVPNGGGAAIDVELWSVPIDAFGSFVAEVPPPLAIGTVTLDDGRQVKGFLCESYALAGALDISSYGGWRSFLAHHP